MAESTARQRAVATITAWKSNGQRVRLDPETSVGELFGINVFSDAVMREIQFTLKCSS